MPIDIDAEELVHFPDAAKTWPGRPVVLQTLHRWRFRGVRGAKLETVIIGGLRYTSREAIRRFINAQNEIDSRSKCDAAASVSAAS
jgi:hypothetical protein